MEPRNRVAKRAIPIEKNEVFLKKRWYGSGATQSCGETGDSDRKKRSFFEKKVVRQWSHAIALCRPHDCAR